ncbi:MAG: hypothetical protein NFW04_02870 [Candidatus Accumulibacter sp.]|uniref:hypothetical protein n=1 Tax=Accumulibacter sp. TaxID=2053492 RepID=UPI0025DE74DD|nr:hypothetical protein [Accumulibacter sp.]MCM8597592.1 hypothetical protein [Accumulibacter sp.]
MSATPPFDPNAKPHRPDYAKLNVEQPPPPTALEQARDFRAEHENARDERIAAHETALKELDEKKAFSLERQVVDRAVAVGTIKDAPYERQYMAHAIGREGTETFAKYEREVTADEINKQMPKEWRDAERQAALTARIEEQKRGTRPATQAWQDGPTRPAIPPLPGQTPESQSAVTIENKAQDVPKSREDAEREARIVARQQNPHGQAGAKVGEGGQDPDKARQDAEREARIVARQQNPHGQAGAKVGEGGQDLDKARQDAERVARIEARQRGEPASQDKQDMPPPAPKPHIRR